MSLFVEGVSCCFKTTALMNIKTWEYSIPVYPGEIVEYRNKLKFLPREGPPNAAQSMMYSIWLREKAIDERAIYDRSPWAQVMYYWIHQNVSLEDVRKELRKYKESLKLNRFCWGILVVLPLKQNLPLLMDLARKRKNGIDEHLPLEYYKKQYDYWQCFATELGYPTFFVDHNDIDLTIHQLIATISYHASPTLIKKSESDAKSVSKNPQELSSINKLSLIDKPVEPRNVFSYNAGIDLTVAKQMELSAGQRILVPVDQKIIIPLNCVGFILGRSSTNLLGEISPGVVDSTYSGHLYVNFKPAQELTIKAGDRIAQLVILPLAAYDTLSMNKLPEFGRGSKGFGSTGNCIGEQLH